MLLNLSSKREGRTFTLNIAPFDLKLEKLGEASYKQTTSFAADGDIPGLWFFNLMDSNSLHSMELILKDGGARELLGTLVMAEQKHRAAAPASPAEALVNAATELRREAENENPGIQNIVMVLADFIEKGGTFTMTINPAEPVPTNSFFEIISKVPDSLNIAVTRTE